jgi:protein-tyrosine phosphatase
MIDLHCHLLPGIDDGPATIERSLELARAAARGGTRTIVATPHVSARYPNGAETINRLVDRLNGRLAQEGIGIEVRGGAEIALIRLADIETGELRRLTLGGGPWLLVEPPFAAAAYGLDAILFDLQRQGHRIVLAHPERCAAFHEDPRMLASLVQGGVLTSITAGALVGRFGGRVRRFALELAKDELIHNVASDAHDHTSRPPGMAAEIERAGLGPLTGWLTEEVPAAILAGEQIPARPPHFVSVAAGRGRGLWRRGRR